MAAKEGAASCLEVGRVFNILWEAVGMVYNYFWEAGPRGSQGGSRQLSGGGQGLQLFYEKRWAGFTIIFEKLAHVVAKEGAATCLGVGRVYNYYWIADLRGCQGGSRQLSGGEQGLQLFYE